MKENMDKGGAVIVYQETLTFALWMHLFMLAFQIFWIYFFVTLLVQGYPWPSLFFGFFGVFWALMWYNFRNLDFLITEENIQFGFGVAKKRIKRSEIASCEPHQVRFRNYLGYGVRIGFDRTIAYITRSGLAVKIRTRDGKWSYVVNVDDPARICGLLSKDNDPQR